jgi:mono/diheme cytochrome c family protein
MKRLIFSAAGLIALGAIGFFVLTSPLAWTLVHGQHTAPANRSAMAAPGNAENGRLLFHVGGCASCHAVPGQDDKTRLGGGLALPTPFGTFHVPNISPDPKDGIGAWSEADFDTAMRRGLSPDGAHYYPAFPYTSYQRMPAQDVADLFTYLKTLPPVSGKAPAHDLPFPFNIRRGIGLWQLAFLDGKPFQPDPTRSAEWNRGAYLVEGPGHCGECHTPRNLFGAMERTRFGAGGPAPEGTGWIPNITPDATGIGSWSKADIAELLKSGFTPEYDVVGGSMAAVVRNTAQLSDADRAAMADYLKSLPPIANARPPKRAGAS